MRTNASVTIYNKYASLGAEHWHRNVIPSVKWENRKAANVIRSGLLAADAVTIYIPLNQIEAYYVKPMTWLALIVKNNFFTFKPGDYLVRGIVADEVSSAFTITQLKAKYDDVVRVTTVDRMDAGSISMHHFQIGGS